MRLQAEIEEFCRGMLEKANTEKKLRQMQSAG